MSETMDRHQDIEQRNRQADAAWEEYLASGRAVSHEAMDAWLASWGTGREGPCPEEKGNPRE